NDQHEGIVDFSTEPLQQEIVEKVPMWRSIRNRRSAIPKDYVVYLSESDYDIGPIANPMTYKEAASGSHSNKWLDTMKNGMSSMDNNRVWELVDLPPSHKAIRCNEYSRLKMTLKEK